MLNVTSVFYILFLLLLCPLESRAGSISDGAKSDLRVLCNKQDAKSCAFLGALEYQTNPALGAQYYQQACKLGHTSSCVFGGTPPTPAAKYPLSQTDAASPSTADSEMDKWIEDKMGSLLTALVDTIPGKTTSHFSIDQCRIPLSVYVMFVMKVKTSYSHQYRFGPGCDAEGTVNVRLDRPINISLTLRKLDDVAKADAEMDIKIEKLEPLKYKQTTRIYNGAAYNSENTLLARFAMSHEKIINVDKNGQDATIFSNYGIAKLSEYKGKPQNVERHFTLDNIIKRMVLTHQPR